MEHSHNYTLKELYHRNFIEGKAEGYIFNKSASVLSTAMQCSKELVRDFCYALSKGFVHTIPYNVVYRVVARVGFYMGLNNG